MPGKPDESLLIKAVNHLDDLEMPPKKKQLPREQIADLTLWIKSGARLARRRQFGDHDSPSRVPDDRQGSRPLGVPAGEAAGRSRGEEFGLGRQSDRRLRAGEARGQESSAESAG